MCRVGNQRDTNNSTISQRIFVTNGFFGNIGASLQNVSEDIIIGDGVENYELEECVRQVSLMPVAESHLITVFERRDRAADMVESCWIFCPFDSREA